MSLHNKIKQQGFTIVELLIVIVVIGILAAITIVAYNGIQNRGKTSAAESLGNSISKKAEAWNAIQSGYPTFAQLMTNKTDATGTGVGTVVGTNYQGATAGPAEAKLDNSAAVSQSAPTSGNGTTVVQYVPCSTTGARIHWFDYTVNAVTTATVNASQNVSYTVGTGC